MSASHAKSTETPYRGNEIRLMDGQGRLIKVYTIEEFLKERPVQSHISIAAVNPSRGRRRGRVDNSDAFTPKLAPDYTPASTEDLGDVFDEARAAHRDRAAREEY